MKEFKLVVAGGRDFADPRKMHMVLDILLKEKSKDHKIIIVSGRAAGADSLGEEYAKSRGYGRKFFRADWKNLHVPNAVIRSNCFGYYNANAGNSRNELMAEYSDATVVFWDGISSGTENMIKATKLVGKPIRIIEY